MSDAHLSLNFAPVQITGETEIDVGHRTYDKGLLAELRSEFALTHVVRRDGADSIIDIPIVEGVEPLGDKVSTVDIKRESYLWQNLLEAALVRTFADQREIVSSYPVEILGNVRRNFILHSDLPAWVQKRSLLQFTPRRIYNDAGKATFGLVIDARVRNMLLATCADLMAHQISLIGRYVLTDVPSRDPRLADRGLLIGRVSAVDGDDLVLEDHRDGYDRIAADQARLQASKRDFDWVVRQILGQKADTVLEASMLDAASLHCGPGRHKLITETLRYLQSLELAPFPGAKLEVNGFLTNTAASFPRTEKIANPDLVFDPSGARTQKWNERGIKEYGPYDQRTFTPKKKNILVICQARYEGQVDKFVAKFLDGMPDVLTGQRGKEQARYGDGFLSRFHLEKPNVMTFTAEAATLPAYEVACESAMQHAADASFTWDLALVQIEEEFKSLPGDRNPYYGTKAILLKNHVAVQNVTLETMKTPDKNLVFSLNHMSLATYAKLGGRPWLLNTDQTIGHELIIGIGSHVSRSSKFGGGDRYVGITTVFSSDGSYHLTERTNVVAFEEYAAALAETLKHTIARVREEDNWKASDQVRLIFHMFKPSKDVEAEAIKTAVEALGLDNVSFAFVHIAPSHPFVIFDHDQQGFPAWERDASKKRGVLGPSRGIHLKLGDFESLVVFAGASELKQATDGMPRACLLKLHRHSTFKDMTYLARQAYDFTAHSWRVMSPEAYPITIKYSDLIAKRLVGLRQIPAWDDDAVRFREIGRTLWFL